jgi:hypothetical protein
MPPASKWWWNHPQQLAKCAEHTLGVPAESGLA